jgi:hexosaminidase
MAADLPAYLHLDLKGAPPLLSYLELLLPWLRRSVPALAGLLLEYEDQFPFRGARLRGLANAGGGWTGDDVRRLRALADSLGMRVVPLVQTLGHMEYVLKHREFAHLREVPDLVECLAAAEEEAVALVRDVLAEVLELHPDCAAVHLGGDEVWHLGKGERSSAAGLSTSELYLRHMRAVVAAVRSLRPSSDLEILMWDDMLRSVPVEVLRGHVDLLRCVKPVVWQYTATLNFPPGMWQRYLEIFPSMYVATAFKGASSSCAKVPPIEHHVANHLAWTRELREQRVPSADGLILTGWQRFDHFAVLCELLPVGVPSLVCCAKAFRTGLWVDGDLADAAKTVGVASLEDGGPLVMDDAAAFPGADLFLQMKRFDRLAANSDRLLDGDYVKTWCGDWQVETRRVSVLHARQMAAHCQWLLEEGALVERDMERSLRGVYPDFVTEEWLQCFARPLLRRLKKFLDTVTSFC